MTFLISFWVLKGAVTMYAKVFKSLCKPVFWGGLPRDVFISILLIGIFSFVILHSIKVFIPLFFIYIFLLSIVRIDHRIFGIIKDSLRLKSHYY